MQPHRLIGSYLHLGIFVIVLIIDVIEEENMMTSSLNDLDRNVWDLVVFICCAVEVFAYASGRVLFTLSQKSVLQLESSVSFFPLFF